MGKPIKVQRVNYIEKRIASQYFEVVVVILGIIIEIRLVIFLNLSIVGIQTWKKNRYIQSDGLCQENQLKLCNTQVLQCSLPI